MSSGVSRPLFLPPSLAENFVMIGSFSYRLIPLKLVVHFQFVVLIIH